ncbi:prolactin-releasing peptide [Dromiciops gliroides]|uniref:prolactin-releasing peptide n=1 Tax=Dromiciops gliroides TaxID=33562 RepID=UPI001CC74F7A|nr:prolactin-releasing peptide [Dromiciops gliroides]XP_043819604.1 prolactin-releasing peptide [Dromiciops gliroides]
MKFLPVCLMYLLLTWLAPPTAECRLHDRSMEIRNPDIDPSWYTGRGIRPVGRFGRRRATVEGYQRSAYRQHQSCFPVEESNESAQDD